MAQYLSMSPKYKMRFYIDISLHYIRAPTEIWKKIKTNKQTEE